MSQQIIDTVRAYGEAAGLSEAEVTAKLRELGLVTAPVRKVRFAGTTGITHNQASLADIVRATAQWEGVNAANVKVGFTVELDVDTDKSDEELTALVLSATRSQGFTTDPDSVEVWTEEPVAA